MKMKAIAYGLLLVLVSACGANDEPSDGEGPEENGSAITGAAIQDGTYVIKSALTGKCMDISGAKPDDGVPAQQWTCNGTTAQLFEVSRVGDTYYKIINAATTKGLDVSDVSPNDGALLHQWFYVGGAHQQFYFVDQGDSKFSIHALHSQKAIDIPNGKPDDGLQLIQWGYWGGENQKWKLEKAMKIMALGDSVAWGVGGSNAGFRSYLHDMLRNAGVSFQFVGNSTENPGTLPAGQTHQEGHPGWTITAGTSGRSGITDNLPSWIGPGHVMPDVVLIQIGTNDVDLNYDLGHVKDRLDHLLSMMASKSTGLIPNAKVILDQIPPIVDATEDARARSYNDVVAAVVAQHRAAGENVRVADMHSALTTADMSDKLHPNDNGYKKMAQVWFNVITGP